MADDERARLAPAWLAYVRNKRWYPAANVHRFLRGSVPAAAPQCYCCTTRLLDQYKHLEAKEAPMANPAALVHLLTSMPSGFYNNPNVILHTQRRAVHHDTGRHLFFTTRELVLDMDLKDWEVARPQSRALLCRCGPKEVCRHCWVLIELAAKVCKVLLTDHMDLGPMLTVFSGGKGAHLIWGTRAAVTLDDAQRAHLANLFQETQPATVAAAAPESALGQARDAALGVWRDAVGRRQLLDSLASPLAQWLHNHAPVGWTWPSLTGGGASPSLQGGAGGGVGSSSAARWAAFEAAVPPGKVAQLVMHLAWPILDWAVLRESHHQSKVPFSLHASRPRLALPLSERQLMACDPVAMPTVTAVAQGDLKALATLATSRKVWDTWLTVCGYPPALPA